MYSLNRSYSNRNFKTLENGNNRFENSFSTNNNTNLNESFDVKPYSR